MQTIFLASAGRERVTISLPDQRNRLAALDAARLVCTCQEHSSQHACQHVRACELRFKQWQAAMRRRIEQELTGGMPINTLVHVLEETCAVSLAADTLVAVAGQGERIYFQKDTPLDQCYSPLCGYGSGGRQVVCISSWPELGLLTLLIRTQPGLLHTWQLQSNGPLSLGQKSLPGLPPRHTDLQGQHLSQINPFQGIGGGLLDLAGQAAPAPWADRRSAGDLYTAAGLHLEEEGCTVDLAGLFRDGHAIAALALDLERLRIKALAPDMLETCSRGIPPDLQGTTARVHLPWDAASADSLHAQVLLRHPWNTHLAADEDLLMLTTPYWSDLALSPQGISPAQQALLCQAAEVMLRLGYRPAARLIFAGSAAPLQQLADQAYIK